ncbi:glcNAc-PI de-N-acetylase [Escherichia coli]|nr:glcNAc-PI de-N-acetylase [Escherichia coli]
MGAHPYDIELGCGASLARLINDGHYVVAVVMTQGLQVAIIILIDMMNPETHYVH